MKKVLGLLAGVGFAVTSFSAPVHAAETVKLILGHAGTVCTGSTPESICARQLMDGTEHVLEFKNAGLDWMVGHLVVTKVVPALRSTLKTDITIAKGSDQLSYSVYIILYVNDEKVGTLNSTGRHFGDFDSIEFETAKMTKLTGETSQFEVLLRKAED